MAEVANQLDPQEHEKIKSLVEGVRKSEAEFYRASIQRQEMEEVCSELMKGIRTANVELQTEMNAIKEKYGEIVINLQDGTYEDAPAQEAAPTEETATMRVVE